MAVLVAIAIPVFTQQLERSREATDLANIRSAYAEAMTDYIAKGDTVSKKCKILQKDTAWHIDHDLTTRIDGVEGTITLGDVTVGGEATITVTKPSSGSTTPTVGVTYGAASSTPTPDPSASTPATNP